jgi:ADP-ribose pyrophosphatase YjhB (NUDIX family)
MTPTAQRQPLAHGKYLPLSPEQINGIAAALGEGVSIGYPARHARLFLDSPGVRVMPGGLIVPPGPWHVAFHANRQGVDPALLDPETPSSYSPKLPAARVEAWHATALDTDQLGRPLHPYWRFLLADKRIGLPTGLGVFYKYGSNSTVDCIVYRNRGPLEFLLIKQRLNGKWGFPGGFVEPSDVSVEAAARREAAEETGLARLEGPARVIAYRLPMGRRDTLHAWIENQAVLVHADQEYLYNIPPMAGDDAVAAGWFALEHIGRLPMLSTHVDYLAAALQHIAASRASTIR